MRTKYVYQISTTLFELDNDKRIESIAPDEWARITDGKLKNLISECEKEWSESDFEAISHDILPVGNKLLLSILFRITLSNKKIL